MSTDADTDITIRMTLDEGRLVFEALAELPFKYVYGLIGKLNSQSNRSTLTRSRERARHPYTFTREELEVTLRALGAMPFDRVHALMNNLNDQIRGHVNGSHLSRDPRTHDRAQVHRKKTA